MLAALVSGSQSLLASPTRCSVPMMAMQAPASPQVASWYDTGQRLTGSVVPLMPEGGWPSRGGGGGQHRMAGRWAGDAKREYVERAPAPERWRHTQKKKNSYRDFEQILDKNH